MKRFVVLLALLVAPVALRAQNDATTSAIAAYQNLDFDRAATLLRRALAGALSDSARVRALAYLAAAEHYRGMPDSAAAAFRRLILLAPGYQPDTLVFPPEVTRVFHDVKAQLPAVPVPVAVVVPAAAPPPAPPPAPLPPPTRQTRPPAPQAPPPGVTVTGAAEVVNVRARSEAGGLPPATGTVLGMTASARLGQFELGVRYLQGSLQTRDLVEGAATVAFAAAPWLALQAGPQIRRYDMTAGAERWVIWRFGARAEAPLGATGVRGHALLWQGLGLSVNVPPGSGTARGGELGLTLDLPSRPFWFGLSYGIDRASVSGSSRRETVAALTLTAGVRP